jgi:hypothetical protein
MVRDFDIEDLVSILTSLPYEEALAEMMSVDGLLILQGHIANPAIPAKLYEYLRAGRPILALVHPDGETSATLRSLGVTTTCCLTQFSQIKDLLARWVRSPDDLRQSTADDNSVRIFDRKAHATMLAELLDEVVG